MAKEADKDSDGLQQALFSSFLNLVDENARLSQLVNETVHQGRAVGQQAQIMAALRMAQEFSGVARLILQEHGSTIFPDHSHAQGVTLEDATIKPTTFAQLLKQKVENFIPSSQARFKTTEIEDLLDSKRGLLNTLADAGFDPSKSLSREEVIRFLMQFLTTPSNPNFEQQGTYQRLNLLQRFQVRAPQLDRWSEEIGGFDWSKKRSIDFATAFQIRGLAYLERVDQKRQRTSNNG